MPIQLSLHRRTQLGSRESRRLRRAGKIPGVIYGQGSEIFVKIDRKDFMSKVGFSESLGIVEIDLDGESFRAIIKEVQWNHLTDEPLHLDFQQVRDDQLVTVPVPVRLTGSPLGVSIDGGILEHTAHQLDVTVKAADIPSELVFDVSQLRLHERLHLSDAGLPEGMTVSLAFDPVIASIIAPKALLVKESEEEAEEGEETPEAESAGE